MRAMIILVPIILISSRAQAGGACNGEILDPIADVAWNCVFPISIGAIAVPKSDHHKPDTENFSSPICLCKLIPPSPGLAVGYWEPIRSVEVTKEPFCMVGLGGIKLIPENLSLIGRGSDDRELSDSYHHLHWYSNPLVWLLDLLNNVTCGAEHQDTKFDLVYLTELDPLYQSDLLSLIIHPEAFIFANLPAQAACTADCVASSSQNSIDQLFWCAGCQGPSYPFSGNTGGIKGAIGVSSYVVEKFVAKLHRQLQLKNTSGPEAICGPLPAPIIKKSQYRLQTAFPVVGVGPYNCNPFGRSTTFHESGKEIPYTGEDFNYLLWRKTTCCID